MEASGEGGVAQGAGGVAQGEGGRLIRVAEAHIDDIAYCILAGDTAAIRSVAARGCVAIRDRGVLQREVRIMHEQRTAGRLLDNKSNSLPPPQPETGWDVAVPRPGGGVLLAWLEGMLRYCEAL